MKSFITLYNQVLGRKTELPTLLIWFAVGALFQGLAFICALPLLRAFLGHGNLTLWLIVTLICILGALIHLPVAWKAYQMSCRDMSIVQGRIGRQVMRMPLGWFDASSTAKLTSAAISGTNDISHLGPIVLPPLSISLVTPPVLLVAIIVVDWRIGIPLIVAIPILYMLWRRMRAATDEASRREKASDELLSQRLLEFASLQPILRAAGGDCGVDKVTNAIDDDTASLSHTLAVKGRPAGLYTTVVSVATAISLIIAGFLWLNAEMDGITFLIVSLWLLRLHQPASLTPMFASEFVNDMESVRRVLEILEVEPLPEPAQPHTPRGTELELRDVSFSYTESNPVLDRISFTVPENSVTALVGPSGCGKSTILRLLGRFWDVNSGQVLIGGEDVRDIGTNAVMSLTSMVFQDVYLFNTTIEENVRLGHPNATDEEVREAARRARLDEIVDRLPDGWDTQVGEGGRQLSGGERQRVAIARAFVKDSPILLLDEVTSSLDGANEKVVTQSIHELSAGRTVVMIAHRLSTVIHADQIIVLNDQGHISDRGTHEELRSRSGIYQEFLEAQAAGAAWTLTE